jgi:hypothetical protein
LGVRSEGGEAGLLELKDGIHLCGAVAADDQVFRNSVFGESGFTAEGNTMFAVDGDGPCHDPFSGVVNLERLQEQADDLGVGGLAGDLEVEAWCAEVRGFAIRLGNFGAGLKTGARSEEVSEFRWLRGYGQECDGVRAE